MLDLFFRQFAVLFWKNWIILSKHKFLNFLRCVLLPIGYGAFLAIARNFLAKSNNYGMGSPAPIHNLTTQFDGSLALIWADGTDGNGDLSASNVIAHMTSRFDEHQMRAVKQVASPADIPFHCPQNFNLISECYAGITFNYLPISPTDTTPVNYTISADGGLTYVNVYSHTSDLETRILPLQLAIDEALIALRTGQSIATPLEWPYTQETNHDYSIKIRLSYIRGIRNLIVIALFICYTGIAYQLPGSFTRERASLLTSHMKAMGLLDSARIISWHISLSLAYFPAWITVALMWHYEIFTKTNAGLVLVVHLLLGLSLASWSFFVATLFGKSPQLAAISSTLLSTLSAILALVFSRASTGAAAIFTLLFPPSYYIFAIRAICGYENHLMPTNVLNPDPDNRLTLLPIMAACTINIFLWPYLAVLLERCVYNASEPSGSLWSSFCLRNQEDLPPHPSGVAISIKNVCKTFAPSMSSHEKGPVTAISNLSFDIPKSGIFVLLGSNGAGKSTLLSLIANLMGRTSGSITFEGGVNRPLRGMLGIVPQKNVFFPDLTCFQTLRVWHAIKYSPHSTSEDDNYEQLLRDCDLGKKIHSNANTLSGGQKRKLQLAIGLIGGSKIVLVDECTSGVDPLSRRAIWRILTSVKHHRTIVFTTHFLDEADLLADHIAILAAPGKLVAEGSPLSLKTNLGKGYTIQIALGSKHLGEKDPESSSLEILDRVRGLAPQCTLSHSSPAHVAYRLKSKDSATIEKVIQLLDSVAGTYHISSIDVLGTSIEGVFLDAMESEVPICSSDGCKKSMHSTGRSLAPSVIDLPSAISAPAPLALTDGRAQSLFSQVSTIFCKRMLIARRSWQTPLLAVLTAVGGACVPLFFLSGQTPSCMVKLKNETAIPLFWPDSPIGTLSYTPFAKVLESPPNIISTLGRSTMFTLTEDVPDNATFVSTIKQDYLNIPVGGISVDLQTGDALLAWDATPPLGLAGPMMLNLATNILYNRALNATGNATNTPSIIMANYANFPPIADSTLADLKWVAFFGAAVAVYPAFFSLYVSRERCSSVQAMQFSNGLSNPIGLWLGHLLWDSIFGVIITTIIIITFAAVSNPFYGLGFFWVVLVQYGIVATLFSYCVSLFMPSPLASFAAVAGYQTILYALYMGGYLLTWTYAKTSQASRIITIIHFTLSIVSPISSVLRSAFVSIDLFSLLCDGSTPVTTSSMSDIVRYGGPILFLFVHGFVLLGILAWWDSGSIAFSRFSKTCGQRAWSGVNLIPKEISRQEDVLNEAKAAGQSNDVLRILRVTKSFDGNRVVDNVSFGISEDTIFAMLGPNGAGKTTTFGMIQGHVIPDAGDVKIKGISVFNSPHNARLALGVCPQFTAIDAQLTVREHLMIYGRLRGLARGSELNGNVESLIVATSLNMYADRLASQLSGGNQRKLALAIALIGNPTVLLIDEFSTGIDAKTKRDMWRTLKKVAVGKAVVITTHSMEEASALANKVGIISKRMLAIGNPEELATRYATYQVHFSCRTREDMVRAQVLMSQVPGARLANDVATRFEVPIRRHTCGSSSGGGNGNAYAEDSAGGDEDGGMTLAQLFHVLASQGDFSEYTVEKTTLENVFLKVIRENELDVLEEDSTPPGRV